MFILILCQPLRVYRAECEVVWQYYIATLGTYGMYVVLAGVVNTTGRWLWITLMWYVWVQHRPFLSMSSSHTWHSKLTIATASIAKPWLWICESTVWPAWRATDTSHNVLQPAGPRYSCPSYHPGDLAPSVSPAARRYSDPTFSGLKLARTIRQVPFLDTQNDVESSVSSRHRGATGHQKMCHQSNQTRHWLRRECRLSCSKCNSKSGPSKVSSGPWGWKQGVHLYEM